jgi:DNA (cytosine-5)-methyltransferase 1
MNQMQAREIRKKKLRRLKHAGPRVLDLFAGCGGLSLGFEAAGFHLVGAVEIEPFAAKSYATNIFRQLSIDTQELHARPRDITKISPGQLVKELGLGPATELAVDVVIGGPPCQAYARVGRPKLREVASHPEAFRLDPRANLYLRYLHYVERLQPLAILIENVPDALNFGGHNIAQEMCEVLSEMGYECRYTLLNAAFYGVPQMRERMFLIAYAEQLGTSPEFPRPTHWVNLPRGYEGTRQVALKSLAPDLFGRGKDVFYVDPPWPTPSLPPAMTAAEAMGDLPPITLHLEGKLKRGARRLDQLTAYSDNGRISAYARLMRGWPGFESKNGVWDHVIRSLPRDYPIFRRMDPGDQYPEAHEHAKELLRERIEQMSRRRRPSRLDPQIVRQLMKETLPPYDPMKFPNKWRKMEADFPARTLMAHLGKDGYSHIHYDSAQARTISVREAARLQSFPDGFRFSGTMNPAFRQIGEAVPPLLANALAHKIRGPLRLPQTVRPLVERLAEEAWLPS